MLGPVVLQVMPWSLAKPNNRKQRSGKSSFQTALQLELRERDRKRERHTQMHFSRALLRPSLFIALSLSPADKLRACRRQK